MTLITDPLFYLCALPAVVMLGLSKGGFSGIGMVSTPLVALVLPPFYYKGVPDDGLVAYIDTIVKATAMSSVVPANGYLVIPHSARAREGRRAMKARNSEPGRVMPSRIRPAYSKIWPPMNTAPNSAVARIQIRNRR